MKESNASDDCEADDSKVLDMPPTVYGMWLVAVLVGAVLFWPTLVIGVIEGVGTINAIGLAMLVGLLGTFLTIVFKQVYNPLVCRVTAVASRRQF